MKKLLASSIIAITLIPLVSNAAAIDIWWPAEGAKITGSQPFKGLAQGTDISQYQMFWQVEGGQLNQMQNDYRDWPHKESQVDLGGWNWKGEGPYRINFVAKDWNSNTIGEKSVSIYVSSPVAKSTSVVSMPTVQVVQVPQTQNVTSTDNSIEIWWPQNGASVSGTQALKAVTANMSLGQYQMYWQVDGDRLNLMRDSFEGSPHKESLVNIGSWNWKGSGPYTLNFVAKDLGGKIIAQKSASVFTGNSATTINAVSTQTIQSSQTTQPVETPIVTAPVTSISSTGNPFSGAKLYVNPWNEPKQWADANRTSRPYEASLMDKMGNQPQVQWFGNWNANVYNDVKSWVDSSQNQGAIPVLVAYNIPQRDCGGYSAGGVGSPDAYRSWIRSFADAVGNRKAVVILEPDATAHIDCLSWNDKETRFRLLSEAVDILNAKGNIYVYIDAGHARWIQSGEMANRLKKSGIDKARGFSLNVSNFITNSETINYGSQVSSQVGGKTFVVETSRNGSGPSPDNQWCNPPGRSLGNAPTANTGQNLVDAYLWVKGPWGSDGWCNGGPAAGQFFPEYAIDLAKRANW